MSTTTVTETTSLLAPFRWTTSQELCLLQALIHCKPVGIHKHFRMIAIYQTLLNSHTIPEPLTSHPHASTIKGIWAKLESLYDLKSLDEREDAIFEDADYWRDFELDEETYGADMWERRLADVAEVWTDDEHDSEERSSPVSSVKGTRTRRAKRVAEVKEGSLKGSRRTSKAASPSVKEEEDTEMHDVEEESEESGSESGDEKKETRTRASRRTTRARRGKRGK